jgi:hypothetical protein
MSSRVHAHEAAARAYAALGNSHKAARHRARASELAGAGFGADRDDAVEWQSYEHLLTGTGDVLGTDAQGWQQHGHLWREPATRSTVRASRDGLEPVRPRTAVAGAAAIQEEFERRQASGLARLRERRARRDGPEPVRPLTAGDAAIQDEFERRQALGRARARARALQAFWDEPVRARRETRDERRAAHDAKKEAKVRAAESDMPGDAASLAEYDAPQVDELIDAILGNSD